MASACWRASRGARRQLDAAGFAPATGVHLGLDHHRTAQLVGRGHGLVHGGGQPPVADGDVEAGEELLALILEEIHGRRY